MKLLNKISEKWNDFKWEHPFISLVGGLTLAVNGMAYTTLVTAEGIERLSGSTKQQETLTLVRKDFLPLSTGERILYFIFNSSNGQERVIYSTPVVTEGHFWPNNGGSMKEGRKYDVDFFGSKALGYRLVDAEIHDRSHNGVKQK